VIAAIQGDPDSPREYLRPLGAHFLKAHLLMQARATREGRTELANQLQETIQTIRTMFPDIDQLVTLSPTESPVGPAAA
jgi:hypothetical protein